MSIMRLVDRWVKGTVLVAAALAAVAFHHNHVTQPCAATQVGAGGMCVTVQHGGAA
ncbi:hypothetical protein [Micromonospora cathayae]|uniref:Uncharacterized protein n=1 Tax=Micromonospora cathayae TaxID=3028804 RepID=A0ABY7ZWG8_9ACTN|nr:hypothetical protein [Micromonospora sp. HUAS 3]WDZ87166.1 hypothetical protein PVK37_12560 [Micromonospora sp. HUAS 3]